MLSNYSIDDIDSINKLGSLLNNNYTNLFHIDKLNDNEKIFVYKKNHLVLGFIHISYNYETVDLLNIVVNPKYRKQGIAHQLMNYMINNLPDNIHNILLEVNENNDDAIRLYNDLNFKVISHRKNYYNNDDALVMERIIK